MCGTQNIQQPNLSAEDVTSSRHQPNTTYLRHQAHPIGSSSSGNNKTNPHSIWTTELPHLVPKHKIIRDGSAMQASWSEALPNIQVGSACLQDDLHLTETSSNESPLVRSSVGPQVRYPNGWQYFTRKNNSIFLGRDPTAPVNSRQQMIFHKRSSQ